MIQPWQLVAAVLVHACLLAGPVHAWQGTNLNPALLKQTWAASWIAPAGLSGTEYGVYHFRKTLQLAEPASQYLVHISADNRYWLFVNGQRVCFGPAQSDLRNWRYETVDLARWLHPGTNLIAAVVWNGGEQRPMAQISHRTGWLIQGNSHREQALNTDASWRVWRNPAYQPVTYRDNDPRLGWQYYVAGALERLDGALYPWGWERPEFDDRNWEKAEILDRAAPAGVESHQRWQLVPRPVPLLKETPRRSVSIVANGVIAPVDFLAGRQPVTLPPRQKARLLLDQGQMTTGYPRFLFSGGKGSQVQITYAEALLDDKGKKGDRNDTLGKHVVGVTDLFLPDGGTRREFQPLWMRSFRWIELHLETADEPLTLEDFVQHECVYPASRQAVFACERPDLMKIWNVGWRTLELGAQETFVSDLSWERIQYVGDSMVQSLAWLYLTGEDRLVRQAIAQFDASRAPFGLTQSRFPANLEQYTPLYALIWVEMVHDYWRHRTDDAFVQQFLPGIEQVLGWFERQRNAEGMIEPLFQLDFVDSDFFKRREEIAAAKTSQSSTVHTLFYVQALDHAADLFAAFGRKRQAQDYRAAAQQLKQVVWRLCYHPQRQCLADTPARTLYSQHANILGVLTDTVPAKQQRALMHRVLTDPSLLPVQMYFRFFLGRALNRTGLGDRYLDQMRPWQQMVESGMTTFGEVETEPRSECHPWSASPCYEFLATVAGIEPAAPGFRQVRIAPHLGSLQQLRAVVPHPLGAIKLELTREGAHGVTGTVELPAGLSGKFFWEGKQVPLQGKQPIKLR